MHRVLRTSAVLLLAGLFCDAAPLTKDDRDRAAGARLYEAHCVRCHGAHARGDGPYADRLPIAPPDLTTIAHRNGGRYPADRVYRTIDGRGYVKGHGGAGMPAWGDAFLQPQENYSEARVRERIEQLVDYLASLQAVDASAGPVARALGPARP